MQSSGPKGGKEPATIDVNAKTCPRDVVGTEWAVTVIRQCASREVRLAKYEVFVSRAHSYGVGFQQTS